MPSKVNIFFNVFSCIWLVLLLPKFCSSQVQTFPGQNQELSKPAVIYIADGWARNSVNAVIFRQNSVTTFRDTQYAAFYDQEGFMVLAKRKHGSRDWEINRTQYRADVTDAHNSISIEVDGNGILHASWGIHVDELLYARGIKPGSIKLGEIQNMTGRNEDAVTYPAFYRLMNGDLLFMYRQGSSGNGNIMLNRYKSTSQTWHAVVHPLIDGQEVRNAYVNTMAIDNNGGWHLSWTWRETWDVATNHDIMYAFSPDDGKTWLTSKGNEYTLPITIENAEVVCEISQGSELINQTSMTVNSDGEPVIATYWKPEGNSSPQYHIVWQDGNEWRFRQITHRNSPFSLSGGGTKRIPMSRPQIVAGDQRELYVVFRDLERGGAIAVATSSDPEYRNWDIKDIYPESVEMWEPTYDPHAWNEYGELHLFLQKVGQGDGETLVEVGLQAVSVLEWIPRTN